MAQRELDVEELVKLALAANETKPSNELEEFIFTHDIRDGTSTVPNHLVYHVYTLWSKEPMTRNTFGKQFTKYFKQHRTGVHRYYKLNTIFDLKLWHPSKTIMRKEYVKKKKVSAVPKRTKKEPS